MGEPEENKAVVGGAADINAHVLRVTGEVAYLCHSEVRKVERRKEWISVAAHDGRPRWLAETLLPLLAEHVFMSLPPRRRRGLSGRIENDGCNSTGMDFCVAMQCGVKRRPISLRQ